MLRTNEGFVVPDSIRGGAEAHPPVRWSFDLGRGLVPWVGPSPPDVTTLRNTRTIVSRRGAGHVPTWAFSTTVDSHVRLESGLEHDLLRVLDLDPTVTWLCAQPSRLRWRDPTDGRAREHTPDLLSVDRDGQVTLWNARPTGRQDDRFRSQLGATDRACQEFGWKSEVFSGVGAVHRANLMWLDGYRQPRPWHDQAMKLLAFDDGLTTTLGAVIEADAGHGHLLSTVWHLVRDGSLTCDLGSPLTPATTLVRTGGLAT